LEMTARSGKPLVLVDRAFNNLGIPTVVSDNHYGGLLAVRHLAAAGHRHMVCIQGTIGNEVILERVRGFRDGMQELGLPLSDASVVGGEYSIERGHDAAVQALKLRPRPTAFLALGNLMALGALTAFREAKLRVPEDVSLISYDEQPWAAVLSPPMTTIAQPIEEMGRCALELLLSWSQLTAGVPPRMVFPVSLISRESVAAPMAPA
jgi:LacI family transcriptional regulator